MNGIWNDPNTGKLNASGRERDETRSLLASADDELENLSSSRHVAIGQGVGNWSVSRTATTSTHASSKVPSERYAHTRTSSSVDNILLPACADNMLLRRLYPHLFGHHGASHHVRLIGALF